MMRHHLARCMGVCVILFALSVLTAAGAARPAGKGKKAPTPSVTSAPVSLGRLDPFWRYSAALGPFLEGGQALATIPDYLAHSDFPYKKRPFAMEVPFADHLSIVRLLGGYHEGGDRDLAYRGPDGKIRYRMDLLRARLQPYLDQGYTSFTLVLDNIPWCFPEKGRNGTYGQCVAPRDPAEWGAFVKALCVELVTIMGPDAANRLRFRVGTEANGRERFDGSLEQFFQHYDAAAMAIREVLPRAEVGIFNISGVSLRGVDQLQNVGAFNVAAHCLERGLPFGWVSFSRYYRPGDDPAWHADVCRSVWDEFGKRFPQMRGISREIHEFGIAPFGEAARGQFVSAEPGSLGAALTCQMMFRLREAGIRRLWHWGVYDRVRDGRVLNELYTGQAWLYSVADAMAGGEAWLFPELAPSTAGTQRLAVGSFKDGGATIMISAYNKEIGRHDEETARFRVPAGIFNMSGKTVRCVRLNRATAPHDRLRAGLAAAGLLKDEFIKNPDRTGVVHEMVKDTAGTRFVNARMGEYVKAWQDSLTLKPLDAAEGSIQNDEITVRLAPPEIAVLTIR